LARTATAEQAFVVACDLAREPGERCEALLGLAEVMRLLDRFPEALAALDEAEAAAAGVPDAVSRVHHLRGNILFPLGRSAECAREHDLALGFARQAQSPELEALALGGLGDAAYALGRMASAYQAFGSCCGLAREHGLGRIEAANLPMLAWGSLFALELPRAVVEADAAIEFASRVGHHRAAMVAHHAAWLAALVGGRVAEAEARGREADALTARIGARRFEAQSLLWKAEASMLTGERVRAAELAKSALAVSRETALGFFGPCVLGMLAWTAEEPGGRAAAIEEAEALLALGCVGHNHFIFRRYAMEAALAGGAWGEAEHHAAALADYTAAELLPWSRFFCDRALALARHGRAPDGPGMRAALTDLRDEAERRGIGSALPAVQAALAHRAP
jgi:tetratricopeptide (TPR) repeat protein